jgi:hypothetical protein
MSVRPIRIGVGGSHSTGKTSFLDSLETRLNGSNLRIHRVRDLAKNARALGFPILTEHTFESTLWIMAEGMRRETEATLTSDVVLIDRPVFDALGYFEAALQVSGRKAEPRDLEELRTIALSHLGAYDLVFGTELDTTVALGDGRDKNEDFRQAAADRIKRFLARKSADAQILTTSNVEPMLDHALAVIKSRFSSEK